MAKYRVKTLTFINNRLEQEGAIVEFDGVPHDNLEPLDPPAEAAAERKADADLEAIARQKAAAAGANPDDAQNAAVVSAAAAAAGAAVAAGNAAGLV